MHLTRSDLHSVKANYPLRCIMLHCSEHSTKEGPSACQNAVSNSPANKNTTSRFTHYNVVSVCLLELSKDPTKSVFNTGVITNQLCSSPNMSKHIRPGSVEQVTTCLLFMFLVTHVPDGKQVVCTLLQERHRAHTTCVYTQVEPCSNNDPRFLS